MSKVLGRLVPKTWETYHVIREEFDALYAAFGEFVAERLRERLRTDWAEVVYVNTIIPEGPWHHGDLARILPQVERSPRAFLPEPEELALRCHFLIPDSTGRPIGRLHVEATPAFTAPAMEPMLNLTLTARGQDVGSAPEGAVAFLDVGHEWIVRGFADVTTENMHKEWGRTQ